MEYVSGSPSGSVATRVTGRALSSSVVRFCDGATGVLSSSGDRPHALSVDDVATVGFERFTTRTSSDSSSRSPVTSTLIVRVVTPGREAQLPRRRREVDTRGRRDSLGLVVNAARPVGVAAARDGEGHRGRSGVALEDAGVSDRDPGAFVAVGGMSPGWSCARVRAREEPEGERREAGDQQDTPYAQSVRYAHKCRSQYRTLSSPKAAAGGSPGRLSVVQGRGNRSLDLYSTDVRPTTSGDPRRSRPGSPRMIPAR
jgi:hypothetical protein